MALFLVHFSNVLYQSNSCHVTAQRLVMHYCSSFLRFEDEVKTISGNMMQQIHKYFFKTLFLIEYGYVSGNERVVITLQNRKILALFIHDVNFCF